MYNTLFHRITVHQQSYSTVQWSQQSEL